MREAGTLPIPWVLDVVRQVALALERIHALGMVHRDVKPSNILVDAADTRERPWAKLSDLGLVLRGGAGPEIDVHALGRVLEEALAGRQAGRFPPEIDPRLGRLLRGMLAPDPGRRLRAEHVVRALDILGAGPGREAGWTLAFEASRQPAEPGEEDDTSRTAGQPEVPALEELPGPERRIVERLAVFEGPFHIDSAEGLLAGFPDTASAGEALARLLERGALRRAPGAGGRLILPAPLRQAAMASATERGTWPVSRRRLLERMLDLAFRAGEGLPLRGAVTGSRPRERAHTPRFSSTRPGSSSRRDGSMPPRGGSARRSRLAALHPTAWVS
jgi:hypothetical protein